MFILLGSIFTLLLALIAFSIRGREGRKGKGDENRDGQDALGQAEKEQMKQEVNALGKDVQEMSVKVKYAVKKLRSSADYLDEVWRDCKKASAAGSSVGIVGSALTIFGTISTAGLTSPLLVWGTVFGMFGGCVNLGANYIESVTNSSHLQEADEAVQNAHRAINTVRAKIRMFKDGKSAAQLVFLADLAAKLYGHHNLVTGLIKNLRSHVLGKILPKCAVNTISQFTLNLGEATTSALSKVGTKVGADKAGAFIAGVSTAFLILDAMELGFTLRDIVKNKGCHATRCLRYKADEMEELQCA